jgi:hypothetical protein
MIIYGVYAVLYVADDNQERAIRHFLKKEDADEYADIITEEYRTLVANNFQFEGDCYPYTLSEAYVSEITVY